MKLVLVRHAQSGNTDVVQALLSDDGDEEATERRWLEEREPDPRLSEQGAAETQMLAQAFSREYLASVLDLDEVTGGGQRPDRLRLRLLCSPMWRALQTAKPLAGAMGLDLVVDPDLAEIGGHFGAEQEAPSADEILDAFGISAMSDPFAVAVDVGRLPEVGAWDGEAGLEGRETARRRAARVAAGLYELALEDVVDVAVMVTHDAFIKLLLLELLVRPPLVPSNSPSL